MCWKLGSGSAAGMERKLPACSQQTEPIDLRCTSPAVVARTSSTNEPLDLSTSSPRPHMDNYTMDPYRYTHPQHSPADTDAKYYQWAGSYTHDDKQASYNVNWSCDRSRPHWNLYGFHNKTWDRYSQCRELPHNSDTYFQYLDQDVYRDRPSCVFAGNRDSGSGELGYDGNRCYERSIAHTNGGYCKYSTHDTSPPPVTYTRTSMGNAYSQRLPTTQRRHHGYKHTNQIIMPDQIMPSATATNSDTGRLGMLVPITKHPGTFVANSKHCTGGFVTTQASSDATNQLDILPPISIPDFSFIAKLEHHVQCSGDSEELKTLSNNHKVDDIINTTAIKHESTD